MDIFNENMMEKGCIAISILQQLGLASQYPADNQ